MRYLLSAICLVLSALPLWAQPRSVQVVDDLFALEGLNPLTKYTNALSVSGWMAGDGLQGIYSYDPSNTNTPTANPPVIKPLNYDGRWTRILAPGGQTNFDTIIVTNISVVNEFHGKNTFVTNLYATYITLNGTNVGSMNPTISYIPYKDTTNSFADSPWSVIATNIVSFNDGSHQFIYRANSTAFGIGEDALGSGGTLIGANNIALGKRALQNIRGGVNNYALGDSSLQTLSTGSDNVAIGVSAGNSISTNSFNTIIGDFAWTGRKGDYNVVIGYSSDGGLSDTVTNTIGIGPSIGGATVRPGKDNEIVIGNSLHTKIFIPQPVIPSHTPASSAETNYVGAVAWDSSYLYLWVSKTQNVRSAWSTW